MLPIRLGSFFFIFKIALVRNEKLLYFATRVHFQRLDTIFLMIRSYLWSVCGSYALYTIYFFYQFVSFDLIKHDKSSPIDKQIEKYR